MRAVKTLLPLTALLVVLAAPGSARALEVTTTLTFASIGDGCTVCGSTYYACWAGGVGTWNNGSLPFTDPLPPGTWNLTAASAELTGALDCDTLGVGTLTVTLNGEMVGVTGPTGGGCACNTCDSVTYSGPILGTGYTFGGSNTLNLNSSEDTCISAVDLTLTYEAGCQDNDGDGVDDINCGGTDCDDNNPNRSPNIPENTLSRCEDGIDNDCDFDVDEEDFDCAPFQGDDDDAVDDDDATDDDDAGDDDDNAGDDDDAGGGGGGGRGGRRGGRGACGCTASGSSATAGAAWILALGLFSRRRRR